MMMTQNLKDTQHAACTEKPIARRIIKKIKYVRQLHDDCFAPTEAPPSNVHRLDCLHTHRHENKRKVHRLPSAVAVQALDKLHQPPPRLVPLRRQHLPVP
jgi:hypothetical protein